MLAALERGFVDHSAGRTSVPPRVGALAPEGLLGAMPGYVPGSGLGAKLVAVFPRSQPSHRALIALFDEGTGAPLALLDGEHITAMRTGGGAAVSVRALARPESAVLAVIGAGVQGRSHLQTVATVRDFKEIRLASRNRAAAEELASEFPGVRAAASFEEAVRGADVVCLCTDAGSPLLELEWLRPGCHLTSVGNRAEVGTAIAGAASIFVEWRGAAGTPPPAGAADLAGIDPESVTELGEVLAGSRPGRRSAGELTLYKSTGLAVEDVVTARLVYERAVESGAGTLFAL